MTIFTAKFGHHREFTLGHVSGDLLEKVFEQDLDACIKLDEWFLERRKLNEKFDSMLNDCEVFDFQMPSTASGDLMELDEDGKPFAFEFSGDNGFFFVVFEPITDVLV